MGNLINRRRTGVLAIALACLAATVAVTAAAGDRRDVVVGVALNSAQNGSGADALSVAERGGARGAFVAYGWSQLEPAPGVYRVDELAGLSLLSRRHGLRLLVGLEPINTFAREMPADLAGKSFDSPVVEERFRKLIDIVRPYLDGNVRFLTIGNEVNMYLGRHPGEWPAYRSFYAAAAAYVHRTVPGLPVGVTTTFTGATRTARGKVADLNRPSDVVVATYYPVHGQFQVDPSGSPLADFPKLLGAARGRPVVLQEVGYPDSPDLGSSESKQAGFVTKTFTAWKAAGERIPFLNFMLLHDLSRATCAQIASENGQASSAFTSFLCSLGLRHSDGTPKPAWSSFVRGAALQRPPSRKP